MMALTRVTVAWQCCISVCGVNSGICLVQRRSATQLTYFLAQRFMPVELKAHAKNRDLGQVPIPRFCAGTGRDMGDLRGTAGQGTFEHD
jgi:hypothetical protein